MKKLIYMALLASIFYACKKDTPCTHQEYFYDIPASGLAVIPYKSMDTLTYIRINTNDTFIFYGNNWSYGYYNSTNNIPECTSNENRKTRIIEFNSDLTNSIMKIEQRINQTTTSTTDISIKFRSTFFEEYDSDFVWNTSTLKMEIQNVTYDSVIVFSNKLLDPTFKCYYSLHSGIIKMQLKNGEIWELLNKK